MVTSVVFADAVSVNVDDEDEDVCDDITASVVVVDVVDEVVSE